ncbi:NUDIX domain-containing protein [Paracoccus sp. p3-h83]|uniref:NUDIX domain-containing protein n=1 Tax=Paracoccus sp. p3-h83 TaxID=3342805 RepID=UPI0035B6BFB2
MSHSKTDRLAQLRDDLDQWRDQPELRAALAQDVAALPDEWPAHRIRARLAAMAIRADSRLRAQAADAQPATDQVRLHATRHPYAGFFAVEDYSLSHPTHAGGQTPELPRSAIITGDAAVVLPYDAERDRVLLVEQFRTGPFARGDRSPWLLETVAGRIDPGETPAQAARREAHEEAGLTLGDLVDLPAAYPSPGALTEYVYSFIGQADLPDDLPRLGGAQDEAEDIRLHLVDLPQAMAMIDGGAIRATPLIVALLMLWRDREAIRARFHPVRG